MSTPYHARTPLERWIPAILLIAGSLLFLVGGSRHPHIANDPSGNPLGSDEFWRHFAQLILERPTWSRFHTLILCGPVLWALGAIGIVRNLPRHLTLVGEIGRTALIVGATLWALEFVLDGYTGVQLATAIRTAGPASDASAIAMFSANAFTMARLGMVSLDLFGLAILLFGTATTIANRARGIQALVAMLGVPLGVWPIVETLRGNFWPGPFTNPLWTPLAIALGLWFLVIGTTLVARDPEMGH